MDYQSYSISALDSESYVSTLLLPLSFPRITTGEVVENRNRIPSLNCFPSLVGLKEGSILRFRCMIQDTLDRVMKHKKLGDYDLKYRSGFEGIPGPDSLSFSQDYYNVDRYTVVSVPGDSPEEVYPEAVIAPFSETGVSEKRSRLSPRATEVSHEPKRSRESFDMDEEPPAMVPVQEAEGTDEDRRATQPVCAHPVPADFLPRGSSLRVSAIANVCDPETEFKLHDVVELIGVVSSFSQCESEYSSLPLVDLNIQVIHIDRVPEPAPAILTPEQVSVARSAALSVLQRLLLGDQTAAQYLLLQLISARVPGNEALPSMGSWGLNLANADKVDVGLLSRFIGQILHGPSLSIPVPNDVLLNHKFYPHRPIEQDFTSPGLLQLPSGATVVLDERLLGEGNVNALNVLAITKAVREQELIGVFGSTEFINFKTDLRFIILTSGNHSSIFGNTNPACGINGSVPFVTVPIVTSSEFKLLTDADISLSAQDLELLKAYIKFAQSLIPKVEISDEVVEKFQADWVESRKQDTELPTDDIHAWATLLRAIPASYGVQNTSLESWQTVVDLERSRRGRVNPQGSPMSQVNAPSPMTVTGS